MLQYFSLHRAVTITSVWQTIAATTGRQFRGSEGS
jgi:hypothetical protein